MRETTPSPWDLLRAGMLRMPLRCTSDESWHGHIPFAFWCIEALQPGRLVEVGSQPGDSYFAFCQAVEETPTDTQCCAVGTWNGESGGKEGGEAYRELQQYNDSRYGRFSRLVRSTPDEALSRFADASIDLLHIDGSQDDDVAEHVFSTWLPKVSRTGVVLLHDIQAGGARASASRLWNELRRAYPSFCFPHCRGLGVLAVGPSPPEVLRHLATLDDRAAEDLRHLFARLGGAVRLEGAYRALARRRVRIAELQASVAELEASLDGLKASLAERLAEVSALRRERDAILRSTSWRASAPLRLVGRLFRRSPAVPDGGAKPPPAPVTVEGEAPPSAAAVPASSGAAPGATSASPSDTFVAALLADPGWTLEFPRAERPEVSVVVVTFNRVGHTYQCLESLLAHADAAYELLLVDNGSTDSTGSLLERLRNVTVVRNEANLGFGTASNQGAARARGDYLLFLNNDATLTPRCVSTLLETARSDSRCGAVGGRLIWPDGRLQEAGSILWDDGTAEAYGRGSDPFAPEFSYRRDVDFCSGALLLVRRDRFDELGGFDERYAPAYYEDVDLCLGLRRLGCRIVYEPGATVRHHEHGSSASSEATALMQRNHSRLVDKWEEELRHQTPRSSGDRLRARERTTRPRLLVVDDRVPTSDAGSGYPRAHALLSLLRQRGYPITFFPSYDATPYQPWLRELQQAGIEMICDGRAFEDLASERAGSYDVVLVSRPHNFGAVRRSVTRWLHRAVVIYDAEALFFVREEAHTAVAEALPLAELARKQREELDLLRFAHLVVTVSERERRLLADAAPDFKGQIAVWGHPVEVRPTPSPFAERRDLLFLGSFFAPRSPNKDALISFVRDVLPLVTAHIDCRLDVVGHSASAAVAGCASERVAVLGYAEDLTPHYDTHRVLVVPHRYSAGIPLKLCEAMARGLPAVVSDLTAQQLGVEDGREVLVGHTPEELAECVVRLYSDEAIWNELRTNSLRFVRRHHDPETLGRALDDIVAGALAAGPTIKE